MIGYGFINSHDINNIPWYRRFINRMYAYFKSFNPVAVFNEKILLKIYFKGKSNNLNSRGW